QWIIGQGNLMQEYRLEDKRLPTRAELDKVSRRHPIVVRFGMHTQVLNTVALERAQITKDTPDPSDGKIDRDPLTGEPTGVVHEMYRYLNIPPWSYGDYKEALARVIYERLLANGITSVGEVTDTPQTIRAFQDL